MEEQNQNLNQNVQQETVQTVSAPVENTEIAKKPSSKRKYLLIGVVIIGLIVIGFVSLNIKNQQTIDSDASRKTNVSDIMKDIPSNQAASVADEKFKSVEDLDKAVKEIDKTNTSLIESELIKNDTDVEEILAP